MSFYDYRELQKTEEGRAYLAYLEVCAKVGTKPIRTVDQRQVDKVEGLEGRIKFLEEQVSLLWKVVKVSPTGHTAVFQEKKPTHVKLMALTDGRCFYCDCELNGEFTSDHFIPASKGGGNGMHNRVPSCRPCNAKKGNRMPTHHESERLESLRVKAKQKPKPTRSLATKRERTGHWAQSAG